MILIEIKNIGPNDLSPVPRSLNDRDDVGQTPGDREATRQNARHSLQAAVMAAWSKFVRSVDPQADDGNVVMLISDAISPIAFTQNDKPGLRGMLEIVPVERPVFLTLTFYGPAYRLARQTNPRAVLTPLTQAIQNELHRLTGYSRSVIGSVYHVGEYAMLALPASSVS